MLDLDARVTTARTAIIVPIRGIAESDAEVIGGWREMDSLGKGEIKELDPAFRAIINDRSEDAHREGEPSPWAWRHRKLSEGKIASLFGDGRLLGRRPKEDEVPPGAERVRPVLTGARVTDAWLYTFPLGAGAVVIRVDWGTPTLRELVGWLQDFRHLLDESAAGAWRFGPIDRPIETVPEAHREKALKARTSKVEAFRQALGVDDLRGWDDDGEMSTKTLVRALLNPVLTPEVRANDRFIDAVRFAQHQTVVLLEAEATPPTEEGREQLLFYLGRAAGTEYLPPPMSHTPDRILYTRANRRIIASREGSAALCWMPGPDAPVKVDEDFERVTWPKRFLEVYLMLALHARAERRTLGHLAGEVAGYASRLSPDPESAADLRYDARKLRNTMTRFTLTMAGAESGGVTDYAWFFRETREALGVPDVLREVRAELDELSLRVEGEHARRQEEFQTAVGIIGVPAVMFSIVGGILQGAGVGGLTAWEGLGWSALAGAVLSGGAWGGLKLWKKMRRKRLQAKEKKALEDKRDS